MTHFKPFIQQLIELRNTLFRSAISFIAIFVCLSFYANDIYSFFSAPLIAKLTDGNKLVSTGLTSTFLVPIKITAFISFLLSLPFIFYQFWRFISPGLYKKEKKINFIIIRQWLYIVLCRNDFRLLSNFPNRI